MHRSLVAVLALQLDVHRCGPVKELLASITSWELDLGFNAMITDAGWQEPPVGIIVLQRRLRQNPMIIDAGSEELPAGTTSVNERQCSSEAAPSSFSCVSP